MIYQRKVNIPRACKSKRYFITKTQEVVFIFFELPRTFSKLAQSPNTMCELSLSYYVLICKGNAELLKTFKALLLEDFKSMDVIFFSAAEQNDIRAMREELHKMYPIASNLNFSQMLDLIEKYRHCDPDEFSELHTELKMCLTKIYDLLKPN